MNSDVTDRAVQAQPQLGHLVIRDESRTPEGDLREGWRYLLDGLQALGPQGLNERGEKARRLLRDDGATYNVHGTMRPWELDLVPFVVGSEEWGQIESGLLERAELFNQLLRDLYGPRDLVRTGVIPPEAVFAHGGFLRACSGIHLPGDHDLIIHAVDMVRTSDGEWCVFADRSQSPSGAGYALENRTVMSRVLPSLFRDSQVHRLAHFFQRLRVKLAQLAPHVDEPRVVVLTPGALNETYFEHAYLANYLGYPLVQSGDLVVRNGFVWMKSLEGLARVDVILRRVDDWYCDPLELKSDSQLGVPGLLEIARQNRVAIANPLGSGVLENPVLLRYLPQIGKRLLGREPRLKSVATYWCGDRKDLAYVLANQEQLIIKPIFRGQGRSQVVSELSLAERQALLKQVQAQPHLYVAQERLVPSHVPTVVDGTLQPRPAILRGFAAASESSYTVMPGGLTRVGLTAGSPLISNQLGSINKDTWVVASEPERPVESVPLGERRPLLQQKAGLPSRVVENLFWLGRYAERAEASLRMLRTTFAMLNGAEVLPADSRRQLLRALTEVTCTFPGFAGQPELMNAPDKELLSIVVDSNRLGSASSSLRAMLNCAEECKELLSPDILRVFNDIRDALEGLSDAMGTSLAAASEEALDPLVTTLMAFSGLSQESMIRGDGWRFMEVGRRLERGLQIIALIRALLVRDMPETEQATILKAVLKTLEVLMTYRRRYRGRMDIAYGLELTLLDTSNPRSLLYQLEQLQALLADLPDAGPASRELHAEQRALLDAHATLRLSRLVELVAVSEDSDRRDQLDQLLSRLYHLLTTIASDVSDKYFDHQIAPQQLVRAVWEA